MNFHRLWKRLFNRHNETEEIALHVSGATVRHDNPFEAVEVPRIDEELSIEFIDKWVVPFYMVSLSNCDDQLIREFADVAKEIDKGIVLRLLSDFNWRTRIAGAFFSAINNYQEFEEVLGNHLLKSEVCYAGSGYCLALASFGTESAKRYLETYLEYYLDRKDLWYDQADAFCALEYLDRNSADNLVDKWRLFTADKKNWSLDKSRVRFSNSLENIQKIRDCKSYI